MIKVLEIAIEKLKTLPNERQAYAAEILEQLVAAGSGEFPIPDEHRAAVSEGHAQAQRGEFVDEKTVERKLRRSWD